MWQYSYKCKHGLHVTKDSSGALTGCKSCSRSVKFWAAIGVIALIALLAGAVTVKAWIYDWDWKCVIAECRRMK